MLKDIHIGEGGRSISDIIQIATLKKLEDFLVIIDFEKAFDNNFLISTLEKYGFGKDLTGEDSTERSGVMLLTVGQLQSICHLQDVPINVTQLISALFQL